MSQPPSVYRRRRNDQAKHYSARPRQGFTPSQKQVWEAQHLITSVLRRGQLYACNLKDAAHELLKRFGRDAHRLGKTIDEKATTVMRGLLDLTKSGRIAFDGRVYRLS